MRAADYYIFIFFNTKRFDYINLNILHKPAIELISESKPANKHISHRNHKPTHGNQVERRLNLKATKPKTKSNR